MRMLTALAAIAAVAAIPAMRANRNQQAMEAEADVSKDTKPSFAVYTVRSVDTKSPYIGKDKEVWAKAWPHPTVLDQAHDPVKMDVTIKHGFDDLRNTGSPHLLFTYTEGTVIKSLGTVPLQGYKTESKGAFKVSRPVKPFKICSADEDINAKKTVTVGAICRLSYFAREPEKDDVVVDFSGGPLPTFDASKTYFRGNTHRCICIMGQDDVAGVFMVAKADADKAVAELNALLETENSQNVLCKAVTAQKDAFKADKGTESADRKSKSPEISTLISNPIDGRMCQPGSKQLTAALKCLQTTGWFFPSEGQFFAPLSDKVADYAPAAGTDACKDVIVKG